MSMGQEVGVAYVTLLPSGRGFGKAVEKDLDGTVVRHEKAQQSLWSRVAKYGAIAAAAIGAVFTAKIIKGGLSRALNIEDAQAKLKGLGHDTEIVTEIMTNALAAVKGTAFGLDAAATIAAAAVAAGIKPGQQLERYLRLTADAATIAGSSLSEMGSILNKVQGSGKAYNDSLQQLADRGIPIYQWLADEIGATTDEVFKLASQGKISSEQFQAAIEKNIAGAALASGDTTRGAFANMMAAMSRWGANLLTGVLPFAKTFFDEMIIIFDGLNERSAPFMDRFNGWLSGLEVEGMGDRVLGWLDGLDTSGIATLLEILAPLGAALAGVGPALSEALRELAPQVSDLLVDLLPLLPPIVSILEQLLVLAIKILPPVVKLIGAILTAVADLLSAPETQAFLEWLTDVVGGIADLLGSRTSDVFAEWADAWEKKGITPVANFLRFFQEVFDGGTIFEIFQNLEEQTRKWNELWIKPLMDSLEWIQARFSEVGQFISDVWAGIGLSIGDSLKIIFGLVTGNDELIAESAASLKERVGGAWRALGDMVRSAVSGLWDWVRGKFGEGVEFVKSIPGRIAEAFKGLPERMAQLGRNIIQGLIDGIRGMASNIRSTMQSMSESMLTSMKDWLGIKSPSRVFRDEVGAQIAAGVIAGVDGMRVQTDTAIRSLVSVPAVEPMGGAQVEINANGVDPMTAALLVKREVAALLAVR